MQIAKWGNSLALRLPKALVDKLGLQAGDDVEIVAASAKKLEISRDDRRAAAIARMKARNWTVPENYRFDRDEANTR